MRARIAPLVLAAGVLACQTGSNLPDGPGTQRSTRPLGPGDHRLEIDVDGVEREYLVHVPPGRSPDIPRPLVLAFHGGGGHPEQFAATAGLDRVADREGFVVAYPAGTGALNLLTWNAGPGCCGAAARRNVDDTGFARAIVRDLAARTSIDRRQVYATGHSNGGGMVYRLAVEAPELVAGIAAVAGTAMAPDPGSAVPVPLLHLHSVDDPRALYGGGKGPPFPFTASTVVHRPVEEVLAFWHRTNGCEGGGGRATVEEQRTGRPEGPDAGQRAEKLVWACSEAPVVHWRLHGSGHGWPGSVVAPRRENLIGEPTTLVSAAEEVWAFFESLDSG